MGIKKLCVQEICTTTINVCSTHRKRRERRESRKKRRKNSSASTRMGIRKCTAVNGASGRARADLEALCPLHQCLHRRLHQVSGSAFLWDQRLLRLHWRLHRSRSRLRSRLRGSERWTGFGTGRGSCKCAGIVWPGRRSTTSADLGFGTPGRSDNSCKGGKGARGNEIERECV